MPFWWMVEIIIYVLHECFNLCNEGEIRQWLNYQVNHMNITMNTHGKGYQKIFDLFSNFLFTHLKTYSPYLFWSIRTSSTNLPLSQPYLGECEDETHTPEIGTWESSGTPKTSEFNCRGQNTSHWGVFYTIGNLLKCRCRKWPCMGHLNICSTTYGKKKGWESNWQFDSQPLKFKNQPDPNEWRWSVTHH